MEQNEEKEERRIKRGRERQKGILLAGKDRWGRNEMKRKWKKEDVEKEGGRNGRKMGKTKKEETKKIKRN